MSTMPERLVAAEKVLLAWARFLGFEDMRGGVALARAARAASVAKTRSANHVYSYTSEYLSELSAAARLLSTRNPLSVEASVEKSAVVFLRAHWSPPATAFEHTALMYKLADVLLREALRDRP